MSEYTYDIDKYTIGVDENGEDGIGMTVAKIESGELHFLGNCYGENARCIDLLIKKNQSLKKENKILKENAKHNDKVVDKVNWYNMLLKKENQELKKQLEENKDKINWYENFEINKTIDKLRIKHNNQQKKFIDYLENGIYSIEPKGTGINYNCEYDSEEDYINAMEEQSKLDTFKEILSKYREIIGVSDENN